MQHKLLLIKRIKCQDISTLSRSIFEEQKNNNLPGLAREVKDICAQLNIPDVNENTISEADIKRAILDHHDRELVEEIGKSKKMMRHKHDNFKSVQNYMKGKSIINCRMAFRIRCELVKEIKGNFKDKYRRRGGDQALICEDCDSEEIQTQNHCLECPYWEDFRRGSDLTKIEDLVEYFKKMLSERLKRKSGSSG